jgi:hypothetical protein
MYLNIIKAVHDKPKVNIKLNGEKPETIFSSQEVDKDVYILHSYST